MEVGAKGPVFDWDTIFQMLRNGRCAQTVGPRSKIFSSEKPPYWVVLTPLSNQNSTKNIYGPVSKFSHSYTLKHRNYSRSINYLNMAAQYIYTVKMT